MNVVVNLLDGKTLNLSFDPVHDETVREFYIDLMSTKSIKGFALNYDDGSWFGMGEVI